MSFDSLQWEESDRLQKELDELIGDVNTPVSDIDQQIQDLIDDPEMNVVDEIIEEYTWVPPQQNTSNVTKPEAITLEQEDIDMFETYENQLRNLDIRKEDALFDSLQRGELTQEQLDTFGNTAPLQSEDLSMVPEYTNPSWFKRTFMRAKPEAIEGTGAKYDIGWDVYDSEDDLILEEQKTMTTARELEIEMQEIIKDSDNSIQEIMAGSQIQPVDVLSVPEINNTAINNINNAIELQKLPTTSQETSIITDSVKEFVSDADVEDFILKEFGDPFLDYMQKTYPNFTTQEMYQNQMSIENIILDSEVDLSNYEWSSLYTSALEFAETVGMDVLELTAWDFLGAFMSGALSVGGAGIALISASGIIPLIQKLKSPYWNVKNYDIYMQDFQRGYQKFQDLMKPLGDTARLIRYHYKETAKYVWFKDNGITGQFDVDLGPRASAYSGPMVDLTWSYTKLPGSGLWKKARIITVEGTGIGLYDDTKTGIWLYLKVCPGNSCNVNINPTNTISFWFRAGMDGVLLDDTMYNSDLCSFYNIMFIRSNFDKAKYIRTQQYGTIQNPEVDIDTIDSQNVVVDTVGDDTWTTIENEIITEEFLDMKDRLVELQNYLESENDVGRMYHEVLAAQETNMDGKDEIQHVIDSATEYIADRYESHFAQLHEYNQQILELQKVLERNNDLGKTYMDLESARHLSYNKRKKIESIIQDAKDYIETKYNVGTKKEEEISVQKGPLETNKYQVGDKFDYYHNFQKFVIIKVPLEGEPERLYGYVLVNDDRVTTLLNFCKEEELDNWINYGLLLPFTPWKTETNIVEQVIENPPPEKLPSKHLYSLYQKFNVTTTGQKLVIIGEPVEKGEKYAVRADILYYSDKKGKC